MDDGRFNDAHRCRQLIDLVDPAWMQDSLPDDDLYLAPDHDPSFEQHLGDNDAIPSLTDSNGVTWSMAIQPSGSSSGSGGGGEGSGSVATEGRGIICPALPPAATCAPPSSSSLHSIDPSSSAALVGVSDPGVESSDGRRWMDYGLRPFFIEANKQPNTTQQ